MKTRIKEKMQSDFVKKQFYMMSNLGLFYIILIAMFGIPLLGTFVVVLIKGVLDFRYAILACGIVALALVIYYFGKFLFRLYRKMRQDGFAAFRDARQRARQGEQVQLDFLNGMFSFSYGAKNNSPALPCQENETPLLSDADSPPALNRPDPLQQLQTLAQMKNEGIIDGDEFASLKKRLIDKVCSIPPDADEMPRPGSEEDPFTVPEAECTEHSQ